MKTDALNFNAIKKELSVISVIFLYCGEHTHSPKDKN